MKKIIIRFAIVIISITLVSSSWPLFAFADDMNNEMQYEFEKSDDVVKGDDSAIQLISMENSKKLDQKGSIISKAPIDLTSDRKISFDYYMGGGSGADGIYVLFTEKKDPTSEYLSEIGYYNYKNHHADPGSRFGVEFDTYWIYPPEDMVNTGQHIAIMNQGKHVKVKPCKKLNDARWHTAVITVANSNVTVTVDGEEMATGDVTAMSSAYLSIAAYSGLYTDAHIIKNLNIDGNPAIVDGIISKPIASVKSGKYDSIQKITLTTASKGAEIYYSLDGKYPSTDNGIKYIPGDTITVEDSIVLKAVAYNATDHEYSDLAEYDYSIQGETKSDSGNSMSLLNNIRGTINSELGKWFVKNIKLKASLVKFDLETTEEANGDKKVKIWIGKEGNVSGNSIEWGNLKKNIAQIKEQAANVETLIQKMDAAGGAVSIDSFLDADKFTKGPKLDVMGYYEVDFDKRGNVINTDNNSGTLIAAAKWEGERTKQFITPYGPLYCGLKGKVEAEAEDDKLSYSNGGLTFDGTTEVTPEFDILGGYGLHRLASIGGTGAASCPATICSKLKDCTWKIIGEIKISFEMAFVGEFDYQLAKKELNLYPPEEGTGGPIAGDDDDTLEVLGINATGKVTCIDNLYTSKTTQFNCRPIKIRKSSALSKKSSESTANAILQEWGLKTSTPNIVRVGNKTVMVFQQTNTLREGSFNQTELMYSVYDGSWSEPKPVWDNGTSDLYTSMKVIGGKLFLTWSKEKKQINSRLSVDDSLNETIRESEISVAVFDESDNSFHNQQFLTNNNYMDMSPIIFDNAGQPAIIWTRNTANDITGEFGENHIMMSNYYSNSWSEPADMLNTKKVIGDITGFNRDGKTILVYTVYDNPNGTTGTVSSVYVNKDEQNTCISDDKTNAADVQYMDGIIYYWQEGNMVAYNVDSGESKVISLQKGVINHNAKVYSNGTKTEIIWSDADDTGNSGVIYGSIKTENGYSEPIELYRFSDKQIHFLDSLMLENGSWQFITNLWENVDDEVKSDLDYVEVKPQKKLKLNDIILDEDLQDTTTKQIPVKYLVRNVGEEPINSVTITIDNNDSGANIETNTINCSIEPGSSDILESVIDGSLFSEPTNVKISVVATGQSVDANNCIVKKIGLCNNSLSVSKVETEEDISFVAKITNNSNSATSGTVYVYDNTEGGNVITSFNYDSISNGKSKVETITIKKKALTYNKNGAVYFLIKDVTDIEDCNEFDNYQIKTTYDPNYVPKTPGTDPSSGNTGTNSTTTGGTSEGSQSIISYTNKITLDAAKYIYTGSEIRPVVTIAQLVEGKDYDVKYSNNVAVGKGIITITGKGKYKDKTSINFTIYPSKVLNLKVKHYKGHTALLTWKSQLGATGYAVYKRVNGKYYLVKRVKKDRCYILKMRYNKAYSFVVSAYYRNQNNTSYGAKSNKVTITLRQKNGSQNDKK